MQRLKIKLSIRAKIRVTVYLERNMQQQAILIKFETHNLKRDKEYQDKN